LLCFRLSRRHCVDGSWHKQCLYYFHTLQYRGCERYDICTGSKTPANRASFSRPFPVAEIYSLRTISCCYAYVHLTMQAVLLTWSCRHSLYLFWIAHDLLASIFSKALDCECETTCVDRILSPLSSQVAETTLGYACSSNARYFRVIKTIRVCHTMLRTVPRLQAARCPL